MKKFAFINAAAEKEYKKLPDNIRSQFSSSITLVQNNVAPLLAVENLSESVGKGAIELKINGSPAFRCIYIAKFENTVFVLHSFTKTTNGVDRKAMKTGKQRYKQLLREIKLR